MIFINDDNTTLLSQTEEIKILPIYLRANEIPVHRRPGAKCVITVHWRLSFISFYSNNESRPTTMIMINL